MCEIMRKMNIWNFRHVILFFVTPQKTTFSTKYVSNVNSVFFIFRTTFFLIARILTTVRVLAIKEFLDEVVKTSYGQKSKVVLEYIGLRKLRFERSDS